MANRQHTTPTAHRMKNTLMHITKWALSRTYVQLATSAVCSLVGNICFDTGRPGTALLLSCFAFASLFENHRNTA